MVVCHHNFNYLKTIEHVDHVTKNNVWNTECSFLSTHADSADDFFLPLYTLECQINGGFQIVGGALDPNLNEPT